MNTNPRLILVGGWEFTKDDGIDAEIAKLAGGKMVLIPNASKLPEKQVERAREKYIQYQTEILLLEDNVTALPEGVRVVYFGGGRPEKLVEYFANRLELFADIKNKWERGEIIWCGSSTGAMVVFPQMLANDSRGEGGTELVPGIGLIKNNAFVIPHWDKDHGDPSWRERIVTAHEDKLIITLDEYTALFWGDKESGVVGLGTVRIFDGGKEKGVYENSKAISNLSLFT